MSARKLIDLSHTIEHGLVTYRGLPAPIICDYLSREASRANYAPGTEFQIGRIEMVSNTGTYLDTPFHRFAGGEDLADIGVSRIAELDAVCVRVSGGRAIDVDAFRGRELRGRAVLIHTEWSRHWNTDAYFDHAPHLTADAAAHLRDAGVALVGIDSYNIDAIEDIARPVHTALLGAGIPIVEHLCGLADVPDRDFVFSALPPKIRGMGTFPVRAIARVG